MIVSIMPPVDINKLPKYLPRIKLVNIEMVSDEVDAKNTLANVLSTFNFNDEGDLSNNVASYISSIDTFE